MKEKQIFTNMDVVNEVYAELCQKASWFRDCKIDITKATTYDHRDLIPLSYLCVDLTGVPDADKEKRYKDEVQRMISAFNTLDPETKKPYPNAIKPYLERMYRETAGKMNADIDWNSKEQVRDYLHAYLLSQSVHTMFVHYTKEVFELFPEKEERLKIDIGIAKNQALFNRTNEFLKTQKINLQAINQLTLFSTSESHLTKYMEYLGTLFSDAMLDDKDTITIDPEVDQVFVDFFSGREIAEEYYDEEFGGDMETYTTEYARHEIWMGFANGIDGTMMEIRVAEAFGKDPASYFLINGRTLKEIVEEKNIDDNNKPKEYGEILRKALTDGKSRVEIARFSFDKDGNFEVKYQQVKLDLDKLNSLNNDKKLPSNAERDRAQNSESAKRIQQSDHLEYERKLFESLDKSININGKSIKNDLPDFKANENILHFEALNKKVNELRGVYRDLSKEAEVKDPADQIENHNKSVAAKGAFDKIAHLYCNIMSKIPAEKREEIYSFMEDAFVERLSAGTFATLNKMFKNDAENKGKPQEFLDHVLFYKCTPLIIKNGLYEKFINVAANAIGDEALEEVLGEIELYNSDKTHNNPVKYFKTDIDRIKEQNQRNISDPQKLSELNKELDLVENTVITSPNEYGVVNGDDVDKIYEGIRNANLDALHNDMFNRDEYKHYADYFTKRDGDKFYFGTRSIKQEKYGDINIAKDFSKEEVKFTVPEKVQTGLKKVITLMHQRGMIEKGVNVGEQGSKIYGFKQIKDATDGIKIAIESNDAEKIREAREKYEVAVQNMRDVYKMIREELNPNHENMVGNINSYREKWVPNEFKNDLVINSLANGIYNLASSLENNDVTVDELFGNTNEAVFKIIKGYASKATPNDRLKEHESFSEALLDAVVGEEKKSKYPYVGVGRNLELLSQLSVGTPEYEKNAFSAMLLQSYDAYTLSLSQSSDQASVQGYMSKNPHETIANLFLVNEEDRDYNKLRAFESVTEDGMEKIPPFDTLEYLVSKQPSPSKIEERIKSTVEQLSRRGEQNPKNSVSVAHMSSIIRGAQMAAYEFMIANPSAQTFNEADRAAYEQLRNIIHDPKAAFANIMSNELRKEMKRSKYIKDIEKAAQKKLKTVRKEARKEEKIYNKKADKLNKTIASITKKIAKGNNVDELNVALNNAKAELETLRKSEIARLESAYSEAKIPKDYLDQRIEDVKAGTHKKRAPIGSSERSSFRKFKAELKARYANELGNEKIKHSDMKLLYDRMMENARYEEKKFVLSAMGKHPNPTAVRLEPVNEAEKQLNGVERIEPAEVGNDKERIFVVEANEKALENVQQQIEKAEPVSVKVKEH